MSFPITSFERQNITSDSKVRLGLYAVATPTSGSVFVGGFTVESANTGAVYHYIMERATATGIGLLRVCNEQFQTISSLSLGVIPPKVDLSYALQNRQLLISAPQLSYTIYSIPGGGCTRALKTASAIPSTTALDVPVGLAASFGDRVVIAQGSQVYFNDPGVDPRTFVAENVLALPGKITDLFQGPSGALIIGTTDGVYALPSDALGQGQLVFGFLSKIAPYQCQQTGNLCFADGQIVGLQRGGYGSIGEGAEVIDPAPYRGKRYYSRYVGPGESGDYRSFRMFATRDLGQVIVTQNGLYSVRQQMWLTSGMTLDIKGVLKTDLGGDLLMTSSMLLELWGNVEADDNDFAATAAGTAPVNVTDSTMVRAIITSGDNVGHQQKMYIGGQHAAATTPPAAREANVIGSNVWSASAFYSAPEIRSRRHHCVLRTDEVTFEVAFEDPGSAVGQCDVTTKAVGPKRPTN